MYLLFSASLAVAVSPPVENAMMSVVVSADFRTATATYSTGGIYTLSGSGTLVFDCDSQPPEWPAPPQATSIKSSACTQSLRCPMHHN